MSRDGHDQDHDNDNDTLPRDALGFLGEKCKWALVTLGPNGDVRFLEEFCKFGSCSGGSVVGSLGAQVTPEIWHRMAQQMQMQALPLPPTTTNRRSQKI
ncbi:hypothetical protein QYF36_011068 [Acer negundo]|nr:hypothetical protein QYF36_011068 [Acer negundo]